MSVNLIEMAHSYLTPDVLQKLGEATSTDPSETKKVLAAAIPSVLAGVVQQASGKGFGAITDLLSQQAFGGSMLRNPGSSVGGSGFSHILDLGKSLLSTIFGGKLDSILGLISSSTGASRAGASALTAVAAPLVMNLIGKVKNEQGLSAGALREMLMSQKDAIAQFAPPGLSNAMGLASLSHLGDLPDHAKAEITDVTEEFKNRAGAFADRTYNSTSALSGDASRRVTAAAPSASSMNRATLIALGCLAALASLLWWRGRTPPVAEVPAPPSITVAKQTYTAPLLQGQPIHALVPTTLPNGTTLQLEPGSTAFRVIEFLKTPLPGPNIQRFLLREVQFESGEKTPTAKSSATMDRIAPALQAFPKSYVRILSYAPIGAGSAARDLAGQRADQVRSQLVERGVPAGRMETKVFEGRPNGVTEAREGWIELEVGMSTP